MLSENRVSAIYKENLRVMPGVKFCEVFLLIASACGNVTEHSDCRWRLLIKLLTMFHTGWPTKGS